MSGNLHRSRWFGLPELVAQPRATRYRGIRCRGLSPGDDDPNVVMPLACAPGIVALYKAGRSAKVRPMTNEQLDQLSINTIRTLSMDAVQQAKSGHPGTPMALAPLVYTIWNRVMRFDPQDPIWPNRDRFVLSNGHASMLLWSVLHLTGTRAVNADYERLGQPSVSLDDIRHFRQLDSKAPGHPEYHWVSGVETTTGPLGQGVATSGVWPLPRSGSLTGTIGPLSRSSTTTFMPFAEMAA